MQSFETMIRYWPDLTGHQYLELRKQQELEDKARQLAENEDLINLMNDINQNGGYYYYLFDESQSGLYNVTEVKFEDGSLYATVESLVFHLNPTHKSGLQTFSRSIMQHQELDTYGIPSMIGNIKRVDVEFWSKANQLVNNLFSLYGNTNDRKN